MRSLALIALLAAALAVLPPAAAQELQPPVPDGCVADPPPCVYVTPDPAQGIAAGAVFAYHGRGWPPGSMVEAVYGSYCPPASACAGVGLSRRFAADAAGRFTFTFRNGNNPTRAMPEPRGAGGEVDSMSFETFVAGPGDRRVVRDAIPPPGPSTPEERLEAEAIAAAVQRAHRALQPRDDAVAASLRRYERQLRVCRTDLQRFRDESRRGRIVDALIGLAFDQAMFAPIMPQLRAFAADLGRTAPGDPLLLAGVRAWIAEVARARPWPRPNLCAALRRWRATGFALDRAPADPRTAETQAFLGDVDGQRTIAAAAARMRALGTGRVAEELFGGGLLDLADLLGDHI